MAGFRRADAEELRAKVPCPLFFGLNRHEVEQPLERFRPPEARGSCAPYKAGDPLYGDPSDPLKNVHFREMSRLRRACVASAARLAPKRCSSTAFAIGWPSLCLVSSWSMPV